MFILRNNSSLCVSSDASRYFINEFVDYWCSSLLISIILLIISNLKFFVMKCFVRICSSGYIFIVTISQVVLKTGLLLILLTDISSFSRISVFALKFCILVLLFRLLKWNSDLNVRHGSPVFNNVLAILSIFIHL